MYVPHYSVRFITRYDLLSRASPPNVDQFEGQTRENEKETHAMTSTSIKFDDRSLTDSEQTQALSTSDQSIKDVVPKEDDRLVPEKHEPSIVSTEEIEDKLFSIGPAADKIPSIISRDQELSTDQQQQQQDQTISQASSAITPIDHPSVIEPPSSSVKIERSDESIDINEQNKENIPDQQQQQAQPVIEQPISTDIKENADKPIE